MLDRLDPEYVSRFESIFVSLDGDEAITDYYRGKGTYRKVVNNLRRIRENGFESEVIARMTVEEATDIDSQVLALMANDEFPISSVHWQLDALFWQNDYPTRRFADWVRLSYNPRIGKLIRAWVNHMKNGGEVWRLYPFVGVMESLLSGESAHLRCGAGWCVFNIQTDGNITPCPVMAGMKDFYLGNISDTSPTKLRDSVFVTKPCTTCEILPICGGRCLYANATKLWGNKGFGEVCGTVLNLVEGLREVRPEIESLLDEGRIQRKDFGYSKYNGCEIIP